MATDERVQRVALTLSEDYLNRLDAVAKSERVPATRWASIRVERELDAREKGNFVEEVTPAERDILAGLRLLRRDDETSYASVSGFLAMFRHSPPVKDGLIALARKFHAALESQASPKLDTPPGGGPQRRPDDPKKRKG